MVGVGLEAKPWERIIKPPTLVKDSLRTSLPFAMKYLVPMTTPAQQIEKWLKDRPKWMQDAARRLVINGTLTKTDFDELLSICTSEATKQKCAFESIAPGALEKQDATLPIRLESISHVQGINAHNPRNPLAFGNTPLCIVYGRNGAGKSGYVRLLKHGCGTRQPGELLSNIFDTAPKSQAAQFTFVDGTGSKTSSWSGQPLAQLRGVDIYDTACGLIYIDDENEVTFEPWLLRLFTQMIAACERLSEQIQNQIRTQTSKKPLFPQEYASTPSAVWYENLRAETTGTEVDKEANWTPSDEKTLADVTKRLAALKAADYDSAAVHVYARAELRMKCDDRELWRMPVTWPMWRSHLIDIFNRFPTADHGMEFLRRYHMLRQGWTNFAHWYASRRQSEGLEFETETGRIYDEAFKHLPDDAYLYQAAALFWRRQRRCARAMEICKTAMAKGLRDGTKSGFAGRLARLEKEAKQSGENRQ
jgi:hypothetical protein